MIKTSGLNQSKLENSYILPLGLNPNKFMAWELSYETPKKVSAKYAKSVTRRVLIPLSAISGNSSEM